LVVHRPDRRGAAFRLALPGTIYRLHGLLRPNRVLAAAPLSVWQALLTYNLSWRGTFFGASRLWCTKRVAPSFWSGTRSTQHAECNAPPAWTMARVSPFTNHLSPVRRAQRLLRAGLSLSPRLPNREKEGANGHMAINRHHPPSHSVLSRTHCRNWQAQQ
jgi:hypothetical protein